MAPIHASTWRSNRVLCVKFGIASRRPSASASQGRSRQGNATDRCGLWTRATLNPRKFSWCLSERSTSRLAAVKLACVRSHFHITQPDQPGKPGG